MRDSFNFIKYVFFPNCTKRFEDVETDFKNLIEDT